MDANLLRKFLSIANQFNTGKVSCDGKTVTVDGGDTVYQSDVSDLDELEETIRKDQEN